MSKKTAFTSRAKISGAIEETNLFAPNFGADGLIPISTLPDDFYHHVEARHTLEGERWGRVYRLGDRLRVTLLEAEPMTGGLILALDESEEGSAPAKRPDSHKSASSRGPRKRASKGTRKKPQSAARKSKTAKSKTAARKGSPRCKR